MTEYTIKKMLDDAVKVNIAVPQLDGVSRFNKMFQKAATTFYRTAETKLLSKAHTAEPQSLPYSAVMRYLCPSEDEEKISVVLDAFFYDGAEREVKRFAFVWDKRTDNIMTFSDFFDSAQKRRIVDVLAEAATQLQSRGRANFFSDYEKIIRRRFDTRLFCLSDNGYLFFYPAGTLTPSNKPFTFRLHKNDIE